MPGNAANSTNTTTTDNSTTAFQFNIVFHINDAFIETYSNMSNNTTIELKIKITTEVICIFLTSEEWLNLHFFSAVGSAKGLISQTGISYHIILI